METYRAQEMKIGDTVYYCGWTINEIRITEHTVIGLFQHEEKIHPITSKEVEAEMEPRYGNKEGFEKGDLLFTLFKLHFQHKLYLSRKEAEEAAIKGQARSRRLRERYQQKLSKRDIAD